MKGPIPAGRRLSEHDAQASTRSFGATPTLAQRARIAIRESRATGRDSLGGDARCGTSAAVVSTRMVAPSGFHSPGTPPQPFGSGSGIEMPPLSKVNQGRMSYIVPGRHIDYASAGHATTSRIWAILPHRI